MKITIDGTNYIDGENMFSGVEFTVSDWGNEQVALSFSDENR